MSAKTPKTDQLVATEFGTHKFVELCRQLETANKELRSALDDLVTEIDCLSDIQVSRDTAQYKAQACWDYALENARNALIKHTA